LQEALEEATQVKPGRDRAIQPDIGGA